MQTLTVSPPKPVDPPSETLGSITLVYRLDKDGKLRTEIKFNLPLFYILKALIVGRHQFEDEQANLLGH